MPKDQHDDMQRNAPQTESASERGFEVDRPEQDYGVAEIDPDGAGDIADEGAGHRDVRLSESGPTPGSAEGERDPREQSQSNVPRRADSDRH
ncbi:MAG TPA: hypothetical protein VM096_07065 [Vicinamibacterales bacterium]|nr:hypothetical protein [Vicinamibacterales bacterium]